MKELPGDGSREPIAIVGIGCRFPGGVSSAGSFWKLLAGGTDAITPIPADRFDVEHYFDPRPAIPGRVMTRWGGFLDRIDEFDAGFFSISPREAERLDPQQRLLLETAWEALEDAGQDAHRLEGSRTGVFVGQWLSDFEARLFADPAAADFFMTTGSGRYATSGRLSFALELHGPSLTIDTACSSSLVAVHLAVQSLRSGESELALAAGVNVILQPHISIAYSQSRMMAPDGHCKFGDASGDGYVRSEGAGVVVLKPLRRARADGDRVYAVIRGSAVNNDGRSSGSLGTPSRSGQAELLRAAYQDAGRAPAAVRYVEAHGTGTRVGDPIEIGALGDVLTAGRVPGSRAYVGSVKTNVGHTEGAAGVAGLIKVALSLHHDAIPASLHHRTPNPAIPWAELPFDIPTRLVPWPAGEGARLAGVSAFGIAGTNGHVVLEEAPRPGPAPAREGSRQVALLPLSARSPDALRALALRYAETIDAEDALSPADLCWNGATRRTALSHRAAFVAADRTAMAVALRGFAAGEPAVAEGTGSQGGRPKVVFVFPGQGAQWDGMARELLDREPVFRAALARCDGAARRYTDWSILEQLRLPAGSAGYRLDRIEVIQPVLVALSIGYAELWRSLGVEPDAVVGHSMGEVGAAHVAGVLDLDQAMRIICRRSVLMGRTSGRGAMALVELSREDAAARLRGREDRIAVAVSNSPRSSVLSGDPEAVREVMAELERDQVFCRLVKVDVASHSPQMDPAAAALGAELAGLAPGEARVPIYSTVLAQPADGHAFGGAYWAGNLRRPVLFGETVRRLLADGVTVFVELGPHPVLLPSIEQNAAVGSEPVTVASARRDEPEQATVLAGIGALFCAGYPVDWRRVMPAGGGFVSLPQYPWQRERHWADAARGFSPGRALHAPTVVPDAASLGWLHTLRWEPMPRRPAPAGPDLVWLIVTDDASFGGTLREALESSGARASVVSLAQAPVALRAAGGAAVTGLVFLADDAGNAAYAPLEVLRAVTDSERPAPRLWFVTRGGQPVGSTPGQRVAVAQGALWGTARVLAEEHPELWGGLADLDPGADVGAESALLAQELLVPDGEDQVAFRGGMRFALRLAPLPMGTSAPGPAPAWRADGAYLITGGLGDIGLQVATTMARQGARRFILLGRTALPPRGEWSTVPADSPAGRRVSAIRALEAAGAAVHAAAVDVSDEAQLRAFLDGYAAEAWPPIVGVIHAAGVLENRLAGAMDREAFDAAVNPKLVGAQLLDRLLPNLDAFILFSSTGAFLAQPGQANYAAANAGLDALAHDRRARGLPALSIGWGVWDDTGLVRSAAARQNVLEMSRQGIGRIAPDQGLVLFDWLRARTEPAITVLPVDWVTFRRARAGRVYPLFQEQLQPEGGDTAASASGVTARLDGAAPAERRRLVEQAVRDALGRALKMAPARLEARRPFGTMGLTSLMALEFRNRLEAMLGRSLSATVAWNYPTIEALVGFLCGAESGTAVASLPPQPDAPRPAGFADVAGLSDDDAARALRAGR